METTTHGIEYPDGTDPITDYPAVAANAAATIDSLIAGGWIPLGAVLTFGAIDGHTFTATAPADLTAVLSPGMRLRCVNAGGTRYFIVTAVAVAAGVTTLTLYGGTDYALAAGAITLPYFSPHKAPVGFPLDPTKWTEILRDTTDRVQSSPAAGTWYNLGSLALAIPIGIWRVIRGAVQNNGSGTSTAVTFSTTNNGETDVDFTSWMQGGSYAELANEKLLVLAAKTTYYLNIKTAHSAAAEIDLLGSKSPTIVRAVCAYL
jgi:hypothetical protein